MGSPLKPPARSGFFNVSRESEEALEGVLTRAARRAVEDHIRAGRTVSTWDGERVVVLSPEEAAAELAKQDSEDRQPA